MQQRAKESLLRALTSAQALASSRCANLARAAASRNVARRAVAPVGPSGGWNCASRGCRERCSSPTYFARRRSSSNGSFVAVENSCRLDLDEIGAGNPGFGDCERAAYIAAQVAPETIHSLSCHRHDCRLHCAPVVALVARPATGATAAGVL